MTRDEFFRNPVAAYLAGELRLVPAAWIQEAWDMASEDYETHSRSLRTALTPDLSDVAKEGTLAGAKDTLQWLGEVLRPDQWVALYEEVRRDNPLNEAP